MKLYTYFRSSAAYRVRIALNLKGVAYEALPVNLPKGEHREDAYKVVNPHGRVPALDLGDTVLVQSPAILEYLDEVFPEPPLLPGDPVQRARIRAVASLVGCDIHPLNNLAVLSYIKRQLGHDQAVVDEWYVHWIRQGFEALETMIEPAPFAFGSQPTLADIYLAPQIFNARRFNVPLDAFPKIIAVEAACAQQPAFQDAAPGSQPDAV